MKVPALVIAVVVSGMTAASAQVTTSSAARISQDVQAISKMWDADLNRIPACQRFKQSGDGIIGKVNDMKEAIACWSAADHVASCGSMAFQASSWLDLVRTRQTTFAELTNEIENAHNPPAGASETDALSLAESAPAAMSPLQLGRAIYEQCLSAPQLK